VVTFIGGALIFAAPRKQNVHYKNPTESKVVILMDNIGFIEPFEEFFSFIVNQEKKMSPPLIYQDSTSVIFFVTKGGGIVYLYHNDIGRWANKTVGGEYL
jgi:hypothetical protein